MEWLIRAQDKAKVFELAETLSVPPLIAWVLLNRRIGDPEIAREFLEPKLSHLAPKLEMAGMAKAVSRIIAALENREIIGVHGDYDVDGITGAAVFIKFIEELGGGVTWRLPHRAREGYGMKPEGIDDLHREGASLIVAVDCGSNDFAAVERANELGLDVIVADHHQVTVGLPPALAVINHNREDCPMRGCELSGAGVAFYLIAAVRARLRETGVLDADGGPNLLNYLDLVALGAVADVVPLTGLNRALVYFGLERINKGGRPGIIQLQRVAGSMGKIAGTGQLAFHLAPRLNAAGRMDDASLALRLLLEESEREAGMIADQLEKMNQTRRRVEENIFQEAQKQLEGEDDDLPALVTHGQGWHVGVIGIVASRLVEKYGKPAAVIGVHDGVGKGSLRGVSGLNLHEVLKSCSHLFERFGGHSGAAGITIKNENISAFRNEFSRIVGESLGKKVFGPALKVDAEWPLNQVDRDLINDLEKLKPHGMGNPEPSFCARGVLVQWSREARSNTLLMGLEEKGASFTCVGFRMADRRPEPGERIDVVYTPILDSYQGVEKIKLRIKDFHVLL